jgi:hypothetical protein
MLDNPILPHKADLISLAAQMYNLRSLIDVGGCWGVNGGYTFHAMKNAGVKHAGIIDGSITELTRERAQYVPNVHLITGGLGDRKVVEKLPAMDIALIFDILLHQVSPDWDEVLALYAEKVDHFCIFNQDWVGEETIRFVDEGPDWYMKNVIYTDEQRTREWFDKHDEMHPSLGKPWRDVYFFWQWGITSADIVKVMNRLGFQLDFMWNYGTRYKHLPKIEDRGYLFSRIGKYTRTRLPKDFSFSGEQALRKAAIATKPPQTEYKPQF